MFERRCEGPQDSCMVPKHRLGFSHSKKGHSTHTAKSFGISSLSNTYIASMFLASNQALPVINLYIDEIFSSYVYAMQGKDDTSCFDDYSKLGPMKHEFVLTAEDQLIFKDL